MRVLSVDLGTSNTVAVLSAHGRPPRVVEVDGSATMPSAVFAGEDGRLVVGREAERRARLDPARYEPNPKRRIDEGSLLLGDVVVPVTEALAAVLRRVGEETSRQLGGHPADEVRLSHPAQWGPVRRGVLLSAARNAGVGRNLTLVAEPVAAAAHFASFPDRSLPPGQALAVYDLGAGTFDCAVVGATPSGFVVLAEDGLPDLGGLDVDQALAEHLGRQVSVRDPARWQQLLRPETTADRRAQRALREDVRAAKEALSRHPQTEVPLPEPFEDALVTRGELEALIRPSLLRSVELLASTIRAAGMTPHSLAGIYLVGGSSRIPLVATLLAEQLQVVPTSLDQPETAVALGAHHVPQDGMSMRTADLAPQAPAPQAPSSPPYGQPVQAPYGAPPPGMPGTGPQPVQAPPAPPRYGPPFGGPGQPYPGQPVPQPARRSGKVVLIALAAVILLVGGVVGGFLLFGGDGGGSELPTAEECKTQDSRKTKDGDGFTECLRQLAGGVAAEYECSAGIGTEELEEFTGVSVGCRLGDGYQLTYTHATSLVNAQSIINVFASATSNDRIEADWAGNGLRGRYVSMVDGTGTVVFAVADRPLFGLLLATGDDLTPDALADFFEEKVQPGT